MSAGAGIGSMFTFKKAENLHAKFAEFYLWGARGLPGL